MLHSASNLFNDRTGNSEIGLLDAMAIFCSRLFTE